MTTRSEIAKEAFEQAGDDAVKAASALYDRLISDRALHAQFAEPLLREWCADVIASECVRRPRQIIWATQAATTTVSNERARNFARSLLDFPLPGGKPLHLATKVEVEQAAEFYRKQAADMTDKAKWLARIADGMGRKRTVGAAFTAEALEKLRETETV